MIYVLEKLREISNWDLSKLSEEELKKFCDDFHVKTSKKTIYNSYHFTEYGCCEKAEKLMSHIQKIMENLVKEDISKDKLCYEFEVSGEQGILRFFSEIEMSRTELEELLKKSISSRLNTLEREEESRLAKEEQDRKLYEKLKKRFEK